MAQKFRKMPVIVEAVRWDGSSRMAGSIIDWIERAGHSAKTDVLNGGHEVIFIETLEGTMFARGGDWIVKGVKGEFYPVAPDIFAETYEEA